MKRRYRLSLCRITAGHSDIEVEFLKKPESNKIKVKILSVLKAIRFKKIKISIVDASVILIVLVLAGIVIVPSLSQCINNRKETVCEYHINTMLAILSEELTAEEEQGGTYWHDLIKNGNYQKLIASLHDKTGLNKFSPADYYIQTGEEDITLFCKEHKRITDCSIRFSKLQNVNVEVAAKPMLSRQIAYLTVSGPDTYYQGDSLDSENPEKMIFIGREADRAIQNLKVTAVYVGGTHKELERGSYTITTDILNMSKSGQTHLIIKSHSDSVWDNSAYVPFVIDVIGVEDVAPLIVNGGVSGKFELASWEWRSYVEEASQNADGKDFDASIIYYDGHYYYYPDGLHITNSNKNDTPFKYALNIDDNTKAAYYIKFDTKSVILNESDTKNPRNGSLKVENDLVYIWQENASKELDKGWIRVYCELKKY